MTSNSDSATEPSVLTYALNDLVLFNNRLDTMRIVESWMLETRDKPELLAGLVGDEIPIEHGRMILTTMIEQLRERIETHEAILTAVMQEIMVKIGENPT